MDTIQMTRINFVGSKRIDKYFYGSTYKKVGKRNLEGLKTL